MKADSSGLLVPGRTAAEKFPLERRLSPGLLSSRGRNSLRSSCSSTAISEGMGSVSMCSVLHENRGCIVLAHALLEDLASGGRLSEWFDFTA